MNISKATTDKIVEIFSRIAESHNMNMRKSDFGIFNFSPKVYSCTGSLIFTLNKDGNENNITVSIDGSNHIIENKNIIKLSEVVNIKTNTNCISAIDFDVYYDVICKYKKFIDDVKETINKISIKIV